MKNFLTFIAKILLVILLSAYALDFLYTSVYSKSSVRNKIESVINTKNKHFDVIFMGSSRANNHFMPKLWADNGLKTFNYGIGGLELQENAILLELMIKNNYKIKNVVLQVDLNIIENEFSLGNQAKFMPLINRNLIISDYYKDKLSNYLTIKYVPFYRYIEYDSQIGFREFIFALTKKSSHNFDDFGFAPLIGVGENMSMNLTQSNPKRNIAYERIRQLCKIHNINLIPVATPVCENTVGMNYFTNINKIYPEVVNCENLVVEDKYFSSCNHLNNEGALLFNSKLVKILKLKE